MDSIKTLKRRNDNPHWKSARGKHLYLQKKGSTERKDRDIVRNLTSLGAPQMKRGGGVDLLPIDERGFIKAEAKRESVPSIRKRTGRDGKKGRCEQRN